MAAAILLASLTATTRPAWADWQICNESSDSVSIAIGYQTDNGWTSEGWWNVDSGGCATVWTGDLDHRYLYVRGESANGYWAGDYQFCYDTDAFTIVGDENCAGRGYKQGGFMEVDTGDQLDWTTTLQD